MSRLGPKRKIAAVLSLAVGLAGMLTLSGARFAASQTTTLTADRVTGEIPWKEPWDPFWNTLPKVDVPLSAQNATPPMGGHRWTISARAVHDGTDLYLEVQWADGSRNLSVGRPQDFTDAVAVQWPAVASTSVPAICMGAPDATVNIWQWRAAWQADIERGFQGSVRTQYPNAAVDEYPFHGQDLYYPGRYAGNPFSILHRTSPVDNLVAGGFGSLTSDPDGALNGWGEWRNGQWRVVFVRPLSSGVEGSVQLRAPDLTDVTFAVWDGKAMERNGMKSVGNFIKLNLLTKEMSEPAAFPFWPVPFFAFAAVWAVFTFVLASREGRRRRA